ncbi:MAG: F420-dependent NADP oxidoreductase [Maribacter sp.]|nr:F420-dependent NADP oxidoreductase [Maribacter sp.]
MIRVALMGTGNVAQHLFEAFLNHSQIEVVQVVGRNKKALEYFGKSTKTDSNAKFSEKADIYLIAVSDDAFPLMAYSIIGLNGLVVHTSGSSSLEVLPKTVRRGVFYPLQTFTANRTVDFTKIPICIEAENSSDINLLNTLASLLSNHVISVNSEQRSKLHLAAVFINNFTNHLYFIGQQISENAQIPFDTLFPLIQETANKLETLAPFDAQTGPARRGDAKTLKKQLRQLEKSDFKEIYTLLTRSIAKTYGQKL